MELSSFEDLGLSKSDMKTEGGRLITQGLFIDFKYDETFAQYTLDDWDKEYKGKTYPSLKKLFIQFGDVIEYDFANEYLLGWNHWQRICANKLLAEHIEVWREELTLSLMAEGVRNIAQQAETSFQASKFLADRGWEVKKAGRPSKADKQSELDKRLRMTSEYDSDVIRMDDIKNAK